MVDFAAYAERKRGTDTDTSFIGEREIDTFSKGPPTFRSTVYIAFSRKRSSKWSGTRTCNKPLSPRFYYRVRSPDRVAQKRSKFLTPFSLFQSCIFASRLLRLCYDNDVCRFRAPLPCSATPVRSNHRRTFTKKFMMEPMWKHLGENYYVV